MFRYSYVTTKGVRPVNQDALLIKKARFNGREIVFAVVCDGIGGLKGGETASSYVIAGVSNWFEKKYSELRIAGKGVLDIRSSLDNCLHCLSDDINNAAKFSGSMGTTYTSVLIDSELDLLLVAHAGDTRLYKITDEKAEVVTSDHSTVAEEVRRGLISEEQAQNDSRQNEITNCLGAGETGRIYDYIVLKPEDNCTYMLCTDGYRKTISKAEIISHLSPSSAPDSNALKSGLTELMNYALERKENDNLTALAVRYIKESEG